MAMVLAQRLFEDASRRRSEPGAVGEKLGSAPSELDRRACDDGSAAQHRSCRNRVRMQLV
jgi:hypothetical protein